MRILFCISFSFMSLFCAASLYGQHAERQGGCIPVRSLEEEDLAYRAGEVLKFTLHYKWGGINSDVGTATVRLDSLRMNGKPVFLCDVSGKTTRFFDLFFKVRERFMSWFTRDGIQPLKFSRRSYEGSYVAHNDYVYMWDSHDSYIDADVFSTSAGDRSVQIPLDRCTYDLPSLFFLARNMDFGKVTVGEKHPMTFAIDDEVYNVYFILQGKEVKRIKGIGTVRTIKFAAKLLAGEVFEGDEDMTIWVTDDDNRVPVLFEAPLIVGVATGRLSGFSGLKHPFSSLVQ